MLKLSAVANARVDVLLAEHAGPRLEADVEELLVHGDLQYGAVPRVYAVKYAERDARRGEHFLGGDPHDVPMPMDYFVWAVVGDDEHLGGRHRLRHARRDAPATGAFSAPRPRRWRRSASTQVP